MEGAPLLDHDHSSRMAVEMVIDWTVVAMELQTSWKTINKAQEGDNGN